MKQTLLAAVAFITGAASVFGQGAITWGNSFIEFRAPIYGLEAGGATIEVRGQSSLGRPSGSTVYTGPLLQATGFTFAVYAGPSSVVDPNSLFLLASTTFRTSATTGLPAGLVIGRTVPVPRGCPGQQCKFQIRVWDNQGGTINTWTSAQTFGVLKNVSPMITSEALGGVDPITGGIVNTPATIGWTSFNITVPEPTTLALAGLGAAAILIMRRRK